MLLSFVSFKGESLVRESEDSTSDTLFSNSFGSPVPDGLTIFCVSIADLTENRVSKKSHRRIIVAQSEIYRVKKSYKIRKTIIFQKLGLEYSNLSRSILY